MVPSDSAVQEVLKLNLTSVLLIYKEQPTCGFTLSELKYQDDRPFTNDTWDLVEFENH